MAARSTPAEYSISRRNAMRMALAAALAGKVAVLPNLVAAADEAGGTWNWDGNAGHTGEMPGPGLTFDGALREMWRVPDDDFGRFAGYLNGVVYTTNANEFDEDTMIAARNLADGRLLWKLQAPSDAIASAASDDTITFDSSLAIDNDIVLATLSNAHLLGVNATTGELLWDFDAESDYVGRPTVVDHIAYFSIPDGICALSLGVRPEIRWKVETVGYQYWWLGIEGGFVYVQAINGEAAGELQTEMRALAIENGSEYWRLTGTDMRQPNYVAGMKEGNLLCIFGDMSTMSQGYLGIVDGSGSLKWSKDFTSGIRSWFLDGLVATVTSTDIYNVQGLFAENGDPIWELAIDSSRWDNADEPIFCAGIAYIAVDEADTDRKFVVVADPVNTNLLGAIETRAVPIFVGDGVMLAKDDESDEIVAIGTGPARLRVGGGATVTKNTTLRGAPGDSAVEREQVAEGTVVNITGEGETANDDTWFPVSASEAASSGWLPAKVLAGMDGDIKFSPIDISDFGQHTTHS